MIKGVQRQVENPRKGLGGKRQAKPVLVNQSEDRQTLGIRDKGKEPRKPKLSTHD